MKHALSIINRELARLENKSKDSFGLGLTYDDVKMLESLIKSGKLIQESPVDDHEDKPENSATDEDILNTLHQE